MDDQGSTVVGNSEAPQQDVPNENTENQNQTETQSDDKGWANAQYEEVIQAKGWNNADDVLQSYTNLEKTIGADKVSLPASDQSILEWDGWSKLGVPEDASEYALAAPEGMGNYDQDLSQEMRSIFHEAKLTPEQAQFVHDKYVERFMGQTDLAQANQTQQIEAWDKEIKDEFGTAFDERISAARTAVREFGGDDLANLMDETGLGNHPVLVKAFVKAGMALGQSGQFKEGNSGSFGITPADAQAQIATMRANPALTDQNHPEYKVMNEKLTRLYEIAYPGDGQNLDVVATVG